MARVASCNDCGARFKVPETTKATRAKCPKCGGVVAIPAAGAGTAPAATPRAPAPRSAPASGTAAAPSPRPAASPAPQAARRAAPSRSSASRSSSSRGRSRSASSGRKSGGRKGRADSARGRRGQSGQEASKSGLIVAVGALVILAGGAAWWFGFRDDGTTASEAPATTVSSGTATTSDGTSPVAPGTADAEQQGDGSVGSALAALTAPPGGIEQAPAPSGDSSTGKKQDPDAPEEPLPTLIDFFEPFGPIADVTQEQLDEWTELLRELYITDGGATGRTRKRLKAKAKELDIVQATPAFLNAIRGVDLADDDGILGLFTMVKDWQERVAHKPRFFFEGELNRRSVKDQNNRIKVIRQWVDWWADYDSGKNDLDDYRQRMEAELQKRGG